ncbi:MAG: squalene/phytoene synthase family protein, partial [Chthoniobacterales bacterium]
MNSSSSMPIARLRGSILRDVSRSFYLSVRLLPRPLRDPIALAYLLARATDTIADTAEIEVPLRLAKLRVLAALIQGGRPAEAGDTFQSFAALQSIAAERALIERLPNCLDWLRALSEDDLQDIRVVLSEINEGQMLDVERFQNAKQIVALATSAELDRYTYLVAGCVGEFWTRVCFRHLPRFTSESRETMLDRGVAFGKGLQLVNILRDVGADLRIGRCYLPAEELQTAGVAPSELSENPAEAEPVIRAWREKAEQGMMAG